MIYAPEGFGVVIVVLNLRRKGMSKVVFRRFLSIFLSVMLTFSTSGVTECFAENVSHEEILAEQTVSGGEINSGEDTEAALESVSGDEPAEDEAAVEPQAESAPAPEIPEDDDAVSDNDLSEDIEEPAKSVSSDDTTTVSGDVFLPVEEESREPEIVGALVTGTYTGKIKNTDINITVKVRSDTNVTLIFDAENTEDAELYAHPNPQYEDISSTTLTNGKTVSYYKNYITKIELNHITDIGGAVEDIGTTFSKMPNLKYVSIDESLNKIPEYCFYECRQLKSVYGDKVKITEIGKCAFAGCYSLTSITIPATVTSIGDSAFYSCINLETVCIQGKYTSTKKLTIKDDAFTDCPEIANVYYPGANGNNIDIEGSNGSFEDEGNWSYNTLAGDCGLWGNNLIFVYTGNKISIIGSGTMSGYDSAASIPWKDYITSIKEVDFVGEVEDVGSYAFYGATNLNYIFFPNTLNSIMDYAFKGCTNLRGLCFFDSTEELYINSHAFEGCTKLGYVSFPKYVGNLGTDCFKGCSNIKNIYCADKVEYDSVTKTAEQIKNMVKGIIPTNDIISYSYGIRGYVGKSPKEGDDVEYDLHASSPEALKNNSLIFSSPYTEDSPVHSWKMKSFDSEEKYPWYELKNSISSVRINSKHITSIGNKAFYGYGGIGSLDFSNSGYLTVGSDAFHNCTGITTITGKFADIENTAFYGCSGLKTLNLTCSGDTGTAFRGNTSLNNVTVNAVGDVSEYAFNGCSGLTSVTITKAANLIRDSFKGCTNLKSFNTGGAKKIEALALRNCTGLTSFTVGKSLTTMDKNPTNCMYTLTKFAVDPSNTNFKCQGNGSFILTKNGKTLKLGIGTNPVIPDGVTIIGNRSFMNNTKISTVTIPVTVTSIEVAAFMGCSNLKKVIYPSSEAQWEDIDIDRTSNLNSILDSAEKQFSFSEGDFENGKLHWTVTNAGKDLTITQKTDGSTTTISDFTSPSAVPWAQYKGSITTINAPIITSIGAYSFSGCSKVSNNSITLGDVTKIGDHTFENCLGLTSFEHIQSDNLTSIGSYAFMNCYGLKDLTLTGAGNMTVKTNAFSGCMSLKKFNSGNAKTLEAGCLNGCNSLIEVTVGSNCSSLGAPLSDCGDSIKKYSVAGGTNYTAHAGGSCITNSDGTVLIIATNKTDIPDSVTIIGTGAFRYLSSMESVTIQKKVTEIRENAFNGCSGLKSVNYIGSQGDWNGITIKSGNDPIITAKKNYAETSGDIEVEGGGKLHWNIDGAKKLTVTVTNGTVTEIPAFNSADQVPWGTSASIITAVELDNSITAIGDYAFCGFKKLTNGAFTATGSISEVGAHSFEDCDALGTSLINETGLKKIGAYAFADCDGITTIDLSLSGTTDIGECAFGNCGGLTGISLPDTLQNVGTGVLKDCDSLLSITAPTSGDHFYYGNADNKILFEKKDGKCSVIAVVPGIDTLSFPDGTTEIGTSALAGCEELEDVVIPDTVLSIGDGAFGGCSKLTSVEIPKSVETIGSSVFEGCDGLAVLTVNNENEHYYDENNAIIEKATGILVAGCNGTEAIPADTTIIGEGAFKNCSGITVIPGIPEGVTEIRPFAFYGCTGLTEMSIPETVVRIGESAFERCASIGTEMLLPSGVTSIEKNTFRDCVSIPRATLSERTVSIGEGAFRGCLLMEETNFPDAVTVIPDYAYQGCSALTELTLPQKLETIGESAFEGCSSVETVMIPYTVKTIGTNAFFGDTSIKKVNYQGLASEWDMMTIEYGNDPIKNAEKTFEYMMKPTSISVSPKRRKIQIGDTLQLTVSYLPDYLRDYYKSVTWTSDNTDVAEVDSKGLVTAKTEGLATIKVETKYVTETGPLTDTAEITVASGYTVTYKSNYEGGAADITEGVRKGGEISLSSDKFTREGFTLSGWKDGDGRVYTADQSGIIVNRDITFYAQWTENKTDSGESENKSTVIIKKPFTIKGAEGDIPIEMYVEITKTVSYNGMKHVPQGSKVNKSTADDIVVSVSGNILDYVDQSKTKIKVKNNKFVSSSGKPAQVLISFKPNSKDKGIKKGIKEINKALKNDTELSFEIIPLDLSTVANLTVKVNGKKTKVSKASGEVTVSGAAKTVKLGKKDFTYEINADAGTVTLTGQGNCSGTATVPLP